QRLVEVRDGDDLQTVTCGAASFVEFLRRNEEELCALTRRRLDLLAHTAHGTDRAVELDGSGDRHDLPTGQITGREQVDGGQGERETGRGAAHVLGLDGYLERELELGSGGERDAELRPVRVIGVLREPSPDRLLALLAQAGEGELEILARFMALDVFRQVIAGVDRLAVRIGDGVSG